MHQHMRAAHIGLLVARLSAILIFSVTTLFTTANAQTGGWPALPPLNITTMKLWQYSQPWHASNWDHAFSNTPWRYNHVVTININDVDFILDGAGAPELKARSNLGAVRGMWETEVTLPRMRSGLDTAPLWLYNDSSKDEIDFEFVGNTGLLMTLHSYHTGSHKTFSAPLIKGDWSGRRVRFGIQADLFDGWIDMYVNGQRVYQFRRSATPLAFPRTPVRAVISMWPAKAGLAWAENWLGKWTPLASGEQVKMTVHGFAFRSW